MRFKKSIDLCTQCFLRLCGFDDGPLRIADEVADFKIFGKTCYNNSNGDHDVVVTPRNEVVLVFKDKSMENRQALAQSGYLGQIVGELLRLLSLNRGNKPFDSIFAVRFINYRVTAFRVITWEPSLRSLCNSRKFPATKLQLVVAHRQNRAKAGTPTHG